MLTLRYAAAAVATCTKPSQLKFQPTWDRSPQGPTLGGGATGGSWLLMEEESLSFGGVTAG